MTQNYFPRWKVKTEGTIAPDETLPLGQTLAMGIQHVVIMFGSTVLAPLIMGLDPNVAIFMSGIGTLLFFLIVGGRVPSYLRLVSLSLSSFAFIPLRVFISCLTVNCSPLLAFTSSIPRSMSSSCRSSCSRCRSILIGIFSN